VLAWACLPGVAGAAESGAGITVLAAASLTDALQAVARRFEASGGGTVKLSFASSAVLARQIEAGFPADAFFSADEDWMDYLEQRRLLRTGTRVNVLGNRLALVSPAGSTLALRIAPGFPLRSALGAGRLALGDPESVPAGRYGRAALTSLGVWDAIQDRIVRADNVRGALMFVARGEAPLGIVYETDARADPKVRIVDLFPADSHPPIVYPIALTRHAGDAAGAFLSYVCGSDARAIFATYGFREPLHQ